MSYYAVLSAANALLQQQHYTMRRCRRRFNGPHRYILFDAQNRPVHFDDAPKSRRAGYTLLELLDWLAKRADAHVSAAARQLMYELDAAQNLRAAI